MCSFHFFNNDDPYKESNCIYNLNLAQDTKEILKIPMGGRGVIPDKRNYSKEVSELPFTENIKELMKVEME